MQTKISLVRELLTKTRRKMKTKRVVVRFTEEEKNALKIVMGMLKQMAEVDTEEAAMEDDSMKEEYPKEEERPCDTKKRPYDEEGDKVKEGAPYEEEERWLKSVFLELRNSKKK